MADSKDIQKELGKLLKTYAEQVNTSNTPVGGMPVGEEAKKEEKARINFNLLPTELEAYLKLYVIGQAEAIEVISTKICTHFQRMNYENNYPNEKQIIGNIKGNILLIGPTGVGKTYIVKLIADHIGVPFVKADATKFSETGYVGGDVEDLVRELVRKANGDVSLAEYGIIYLDEIDKIASSRSTNNPDISRSGVQRNLLKIMEDSDVDLKNPFDIGSQMEVIIEAQQKKNVQRKKINTKNILFVMSGAFGGLTEIITKRLNLRSVGFNHHDSKKKNIEKNILSLASQEDLINFGFESEFIGRLPVITVLDELDVDGLYKILQNPKASVILSKKRDFKSYGIDISFEDNALKHIATLAAKEKTGARSLLSIIEKKLIKFEKQLPSTNITSLTVNNELIENPTLELNSLLLQEGIRHICLDFKTEHNINLIFNQNSLDKIAALSTKNNVTPYDYCNNLLKDYKYGLKLAGEKDFEITEEVIENNKEYLDRFIKNAYKNRKSS